MKIAKAKRSLNKAHDMLARPQDMLARPQDMLARPQDMLARPQDLIYPSRASKIVAPKSKLGSIVSTQSDRRGVVNLCSKWHQHSLRTARWRQKISVLKFVHTTVLHRARF
jgi:hypothetical protein